MELNSHLTSHDQVLNLPTTCKPESHSDFIAKAHYVGDNKSNYFDECSNSEGSHEFLPNARLRRSRSLGNLEDAERASSGGDITEENAFWDRKGVYRDMEKINDENADGYAKGHNLSGRRFRRKHDNSAEETLNQFTEPDQQDSLSSAGTFEHIVVDNHDDANVQSSADACSIDISLNVFPTLSKSRSLSNLQVNIADTNNLDYEVTVIAKSRSFGNLCSIDYKKVLSTDCHETVYSRLDFNRKESEKQGSVRQGEFDEYYPSDSTVGSNEVLHQKKDRVYFDEHECNSQIAKTEEGSISKADSLRNCLLSYNGVERNEVLNQERGKQICGEISKEYQSEHGSDLQRYDGETLSWTPPEIDGEHIMNKLTDDDSFVPNVDELTNEEFSIRRVREWINQIDIQSDNIVEEVGESSKSVDNKHSNKASITASKKLDSKSSLGMEVAYNYISTLNPTSSSARMINMGLIAIPSLSAYTGLKTLNLSGNSIARITAGSLPKGLHVLNLSKNNIPGIEGLRELTRLRILDLSYNRISRIGHGLSSCSSLRELYLAGNKISEVEGLHRLLKLNILDLSSNKIATSKGLGQLAANYASLQVINLEGNPAQKNTGDEQLKKFLLSILPYLQSYNKKVIRTSGSKEVTVNRATRPLPSPQSERSMRSDHRRSRRTGVSTGSHKSSSSNVQSGNVLSSLLKSSKAKRGKPLPPVASKQTNQVPKSSLKLPSFRSSGLIRRIQSEGTLIDSF